MREYTYYMLNNRHLLGGLVQAMQYFKKASDLGDEESADNLMFAASVNDQVHLVLSHFAH